MVKVLFVCMGNICRSPTAEGVFRHVVEEAGLSHLIEIDSAGTHAYHIGEQPDRRSQATALRRGFDLSAQQARKVIRQDFEEYTYVLAMDRDNYANLGAICSEDLAHKITLFLEHGENISETEVPDPYYGGENGFEHVLDLIEDASKGLLLHIQTHHL
ncbi:MAG: low molecular weight phosphotyrosine protein phosphatase [Gammaproteobacteria bacterium]|nr:low molecular weight phosphotyrosine protein phosphatase [Gammaproteobacteria bacterium]